MSDFAQRLAAVARDTEAALETILQAATDPAPPQRLIGAMRYAVLGGGKRLRPFLTVETARFTGGDAEAALRAGAAIELVHVYSLVHDDLPAMDDDELRRGKPTVHRAYDEATAILVGDALQTLAFETLGDPATHADAGIRAALVLALARAAGAAGMAGGQMLDLEAEGRFGDGLPLELSAGAIRQLQAMKTGAILACAVEMGAIIGGADAASRAALHAYGRALGAAFQVADDILDVESSADALGKATGKDAARGKGTLVSVLGLEAARAERDALADEAVAALAAFGPEADGLREAARFAAGRRS
ncbi:polyprenyl synthetase family protein [Labrys wisconsinensis]|uniref:Farnesyl diphosphate synthase n=1 Tax=Labrys wisconsinensis TaxID=425677 RepID=A0ABU0JP98_9HYPH|nr:farnesyl diphosphate synthase [Labrys wisconsinensis]MDQ0475109.1 farnesyl diphosphate synthase [Labrys wisconsinensis]